MWKVRLSKMVPTPTASRLTRITRRPRESVVEMAEEGLAEPTAEGGEKEGQRDDRTVPMEFSAHGYDEDTESATRAGHNEGHHEGDNNDEPSIEDGRTMRNLWQAVRPHVKMPELGQVDQA